MNNKKKNIQNRYLTNPKILNFTIQRLNLLVILSSTHIIMHNESHKMTKKLCSPKPSAV